MDPQINQYLVRSESTNTITQGVGVPQSALAEYLPLTGSVSGVTKIEPNAVKVLSDLSILAEGYDANMMSESIIFIETRTKPNYKLSSPKVGYNSSISEILRHKSDSLLEASTAFNKKFADKFTNLQKTIGIDLFNQLSFDQKVLMADTLGSVNLGENIDIENIFTYITQY